MLAASVERDGSRLVLDLRWAALRSAPGDYTTFVHLIGDSPEPIAQADGYPVGQLYPPNSWQTGDQIADRRYLDPPSPTPRGNWRVLVGFYDRESGLRARATTAAGAAIRDDAVPVDVPMGG